MNNNLEEGAERDDLATEHLITPAMRLAVIAEILADGIRRGREDARRMGENPQHQEREDSGLESFEPVRLDRPPRASVDALRAGESR